MSDAMPRPVHLGKVVDGLAENPALPSAFIRRLFGYRKGFGTVAKRTDLTGDMIAEIIATDDHWLIHSLALNGGLPRVFRMMLAEHPDPAIRRAVAVAADGAPRELFERLAKDADPQVREYVAQSDHVPADLRALLAKDPAPEVRAALAQWWTTAPEPVRRLLLTDPDDSVRAGACATYSPRGPHPVPPADLVPALLADPVTRAGAVRHCALGTATARRLAGDPDDDVRAELAGHPDLPPALPDELARDPNPCVAVRVFARQDTPEPTRAAIHAQIRYEAPPPTPRANHQNHQDQLNLLDLDEEAHEREFMVELARSELRTLRLPWVTADPLPYVDSTYVCFRVSAAMSDRLPPPLVARLLADEESSVRTTMALHAREHVDPDTAERIDRTYRPFKRVRWRPADDFPLPVEVLRRLATDCDPRMRQLATRDPDLPVGSVRSLAADPDPDAAVRRAAAAHPRLPAADVTRLLADPSEFVAAAAAANPNLPTTAMHHILALADL
ncbi:hypothetical protein [Streptomyces liangshanensis]|uniref:hypothetical protein n=1 Tax=Streptomyces liangshanensis TaxID=2717324 RepID=UPI0036DF9625